MPVLTKTLSDLKGRALHVARARGKFGALPPGPPEPALAQTAQWLGRPTHLLQRAFDRYGEVFTIRLIGMDPFVMFAAPDAVKDVFTGPAEQLYAGQANVVLTPVVGPNSVLILDGARHMSQRRLLLPPFHGRRMREYGAAMRDATLESIASWPRGRAFPVHERTQAITMDVILRTVFGMDAGSEFDELRATLGRLLNAIANPLFIVKWIHTDYGPLSPGHRLKRIGLEVDRLIHAQIRRRRAAGREGRADVLSMLLEARHEDGTPMSDAELRDELVTLLVAGHETTATALAWTLLRLLENPSVLEQAIAEVDRVFGRSPIEPDAVRELTWIDAVIKETLRLNPILPIVGRRLQAPMRIGGIELPRGVIAVPNIYGTHRNPRVWPDPERFDPARFVDAKISPYAFFPFGGGVRRCIGMAFAHYEMQVVLATILQRLRLRAAPGYVPRLVRRSITFAPSEGMPLVVEDRG